MLDRISALLICILLLSSCATHHKSLSGIQNWSFPNHQFDKVFSFSYVDNLLEKTSNKSSARWANRKNIHVIGIRLTNNGNKAIHGSQIAFQNNGEEVEIMHNRWMAKKIRQRFSPLLILWVPVGMIEAMLFPPKEDAMGFTVDETNYICQQFMRSEEKKRMNANFNLYQELMDFQLANRVIHPGETVLGVIGVKSKKQLDHLKVIARSSDFTVLSEKKIQN